MSVKYTHQAAEYCQTVRSIVADGELKGADPMKLEVNIQTSICVRVGEGRSKQLPDRHNVVVRNCVVEKTDETTLLVATIGAVRQG